MSTLFVNNLNTASGTTITVPTGKKLVGTDTGSIKSPGQIIQIQRTTQTTGNSSTTSTSFVSTALSVDITPKFANSLIKIECQTVWWLHLSPSSEEYLLTTVYRTISGGSATNIGGGSNGRVIQFRSGYVDSGNAYNYNNGFHLFTFDTPNTTSSVNYKLYLASGSGNEVRYIDQTTENSIVAMEIAQ